MPGLHLGLQIYIRRRNDTSLVGQGLGPPDALEASFLQDTQQSLLYPGVCGSDFVEEDRPISSLFEAARSLAQGTGEGSSLVTEQLRLEYALRKPRAVDADKGGERACELRWWMNRAMPPLPVPLSPVIRVVASERAMLTARPNT